MQQVEGQRPPSLIQLWQGYPSLLQPTSIPGQAEHLPPFPVTRKTHSVLLRPLPVPSLMPTVAYSEVLVRRGSTALRRM